VRKEKYLEVEEIAAYKRSFGLSNYVWGIVNKWGYFEKHAIGKQLVRAVDSISANIAEGFNRYHRKDKSHFYYYALGSMGESKDWIEKARVRKLINKDEYVYIINELQKLPREIYSLINYTYKKLKE